MMPGLSRRLGRALGMKTVSPAEHVRVADAAAKAGIDNWEDLPANIRALVEDIERRPQR